ncbi:DNA-binding transcriptional MerR regulator [Microbacterium terrae]|uniref:MerR family regulatory protein n=1 Tax=Microbacterium terrae TaxID=69369 RepID=A0A0M2HKK2_9MICO|nr:MerR family transcriptional regulator [Microbacterium terrae]KJL44921.1 MerR family regulatory protein [Microbacterium terrae]MBP1076743.1 DNA-binding transcriptional MerR regulator [Microbacterium terrae]GLJ97574.1 MerR family transcriptional regulator [Microbacterium terrae]
MRISELSASTGVPIATIKYYLREGLLPEGVRTSATQAVYGDLHERRLGVIRALVSSGVSIADIRRVIAALDDPPASPHELLGLAHSAVTPPADETIDLAAAEVLATRLGWTPGMCDPALLGQIARSLETLDLAGFTVPDAVMSAYLDAAAAIAQAELSEVPAESAEAAVRYVVLGSVLVEPLLLGLRRVAEQVASSQRFGSATGAPAAPMPGQSSE